MNENYTYGRKRNENEYDVSAAIFVLLW